MSERRLPTGDGRKLIYGAIAAFLVTGGLMVSLGGRLAPAGIPEPRFALDDKARPLRTDTGEGPGVFQVTLDTADSRHYVPFDLAAGAIRPVSAIEVQLAQSAGLPDLMVRRYSLRAPRGALRLGRVTLAEARLPAADHGAGAGAASPAWQLDEKIGGELQNPAFRGWYQYSYWTHVLHSTGEVYAVRLTGGGVAYVKVVSYYCEPEGSGCLTLRYRLDLERSPGQ